ncbi:hypothetical protein N181_22015 [Sinorhizobium fredii USDA 205]|nr:hypothetical protein [Sinorhizobium fredii]KSV86187.1 hypothetical protein N181_22015 [Sinorhizobium fredii USDA 205]
MIEKKESTARCFSGGLFRIGDADRCADRAAQGRHGEGTVELAGGINEN